MSGSRAGFSIVVPPTSFYLTPRVHARDERESVTLCGKLTSDRWEVRAQGVDSTAAYNRVTCRTCESVARKVRARELREMPTFGDKMYVSIKTRGV